MYARWGVENSSLSVCCTVLLHGLSEGMLIMQVLRLIPGLTSMVACLARKRGPSGGAKNRLELVSECAERAQPLDPASLLQWLLRGL